MAQEYVLRDRDDEEIERLHFQHRVWQEETELALQHAVVETGEDMVDLGCGPGYLGMDLLERAGGSGKVYCLDNSEKFIRFIEDRKIGNLVPLRLDIRHDLPRFIGQYGEMDKVWCRWVLMFTGQAQKITSQVFQMLRTGGKFISMEYFDFRRISVFPESRIFDRIHQQVWELLRKGGGDPDLGGSMHQLMGTAGFRNIRVLPLYKSGPSGSPLWQWMERTNANHHNLVRAGLITAEELEQYHADWAKKSESDISFVTAPPLMITIGEKTC